MAANRSHDKKWIRSDIDEQTDPSWWVEELWVKAFDTSTEKKEK